MIDEPSPVGASGNLTFKQTDDGFSSRFKRSPETAPFSKSEESSRIAAFIAAALDSQTLAEVSEIFRRSLGSE